MIKLLLIGKQCTYKYKYICRYNVQMQLNVHMYIQRYFSSHSKNILWNHLFRVNLLYWRNFSKIFRKRIFRIFKNSSWKQLVVCNRKWGDKSNRLLTSRIDEIFFWWERISCFSTLCTVYCNLDFAWIQF